MAQRDIVLRWIAQAAQVVARLLGLGGPKDLELAKDTVAQAMESLLGGLATLVPTADAATAARLIHDPERVLGYAWLLELQAAIVRADGDEAEALRLEERSRTCYRAALEADPDLASGWKPGDTPGAADA